MSKAGVGQGWLVELGIPVQSKAKWASASITRHNPVQGQLGLNSPLLQNFLLGKELLTSEECTRES